MICGIYQITNTENNKFYIGSSYNVSHRWRKHRTNLILNKHHSSHLQNSWNKHGEECFRFDVLEITELSKLIIREQYYIDTLKPQFNMLPNAGSPLGVKLSEETKNKIKLKLTGYKHTEETKRKVSAATKNRKVAPNRDKINWPHYNGAKCKCSTCDLKRKDYMRNYRKTYVRKKR